MAHHGGPDVLAFDLVPEDDDVSPTGDDARNPDPSPGGVAPSHLTQAGRRAARWLRGRTPTQLVAGSLTVALAVGGVAAAVVLDGRANTARLLAATGAVADLSTPVHQRWSVTFPTYADENRTPPQTVGVLRGTPHDVVVIAVSDPELAPPPAAIVDDHRDSGAWLHGVDLETGAQLWDVPLGDTVGCGTSPVNLGGDRTAAPTVEPDLVCTTGHGLTSRVVVVRPDGTTTVRTPDGLDPTTELRPGPAGTVWRTDRPGPLPDGLQFVDDPAWLWRYSQAFDPPPVVLTAENALTGESLWTTKVAASRILEDSDWSSCVNPARLTTVFDIGALTAEITEDGAELNLCGITLVVSADGTVLSTFPTTSRPVTSWPRVRTLAGGGIALSRGVAGDTWYLPWTRPSDVYDRQGQKVVHLPGGPLDPMATDGTGGMDAAGSRGGVFLTRDEAQRLEAVTTDGTILWDHLDRPVAVGAVAQADGVMVLVRHGDDSMGELVGVDVQSGVTLWTSAPLGGMGAGVDAEMYLRDAWTDGQVVVVVTPANLGAQAPQTWTAYGVRTGAVIWQLGPKQVEAFVTSTGQCSGVAGRLLCIDGGKVSRIA